MIKNRFEHSNITNAEAEYLYSILNKYEYHEEQWVFQVKIMNQVNTM
jgi:hypothetical protein